ncbi:MAG: hypothetical protein MUF81_19110 [Verrucomicrobia bacterium]|jgi:hypothetical protein|nr:hypothetical protein [Verrucomicrobiota bacterium]
MIHLELTNEEEQYLKEEVQKRLTDLDHEISYTDSIRASPVTQGKK